jgi:hypothetical protein
LEIAKSTFEHERPQNPDFEIAQLKMHSSIVALFWIFLGPVHASTPGITQAFVPSSVAERSQNLWIQTIEIDRHEA